MDKQTLHLWCAYPDDLLQQEAAQACLRLLSDDEQARWRMFKFDRHRREYLATHALLRIALSRYYALPPQAWRFKVNRYGKPSVDPDCGLRFNLSNSPGLVACFIGKGSEVGVDLEPRLRAHSILEVGPRMFSPAELAQLEDLHEDLKAERALRLWTLKEAYIKARGMGLALPLNKFTFAFDDAETIRLSMEASFDDTPERWRFCILDHAQHAIALMSEDRDIPELCAWELRYPYTGPQQLDLGPVRWFPEL